MAWELYKSGTVAQVQAAVNALVATDQSASSNAQIVRAKAIMLAEIAAVGGTFLQIQANGAFLDGNSSIDVTVGPVPFVDVSGNPVAELSPNPAPNL